MLLPIQEFSFHPFKRKQTVFYEGHPALGVYWVKTGRVKVYKLGYGGRPYILYFANPGDLLGIECFGEGDSFNSTGEMLEDGTLGFIGKKLFLEWLHTHPGNALQLSGLLARRVRTSEEERLHLAIGMVRERTARLFVLLARAYGTPVSSGIQIGVKLSREELANLAGTVPGTLMRLLKQFREEGILLLEGKNIIIRKPEFFEKIARKI